VLTWTRDGPPTPLLAIWGSGANDIIASGQGDILHWKGGPTWSYETSNTSQRMEGIWGSGPSDIYISVYSNVILHSTGNGTWDHQITTAGYTFHDVWGVGPNDVYASGSTVMHSTGDGIWSDSWGFSVKAVWGSSPTDVYSTGGTDVIHLTSRGWTREPTSATNLEDVFGSGPDDVYAIGSGKILHSTGDGVWTVQADSATTGGGVTCIWALEPHAVYVGTNDSRVLYSGGDGRWFSQTVDASKPSLNIEGIWGASPENLYIATGVGIYHGVKP
jgi:hypothetical protein